MFSSPALHVTVDNFTFYVVLVDWQSAQCRAGYLLAAIVAGLGQRWHDK